MIEKKIIIRLLFIQALCLAIIPGLIGCRSVAPVATKKKPVPGSVAKPGLDSLYDAISIRDSGAILNLAVNGGRTVADEAWRALHVTRINSDSLYLAATAAGTYPAWFALGGHSLDNGRIRDLEQRWLSEPDDRGGISLVFGLQGDEQCLRFLVDNHSEVAGTEAEYPAALAISRLALRYKHGIAPDSLVQWAIHSDRQDLFQAYLYAGYRSMDSSIPASLDHFLFQYRNNHSSADILTRQFIVNITSKNADPVLLNRLDTMNLKSVKPTLGVEIARALSHYSLNDTTYSLYKQLFDNGNDNVVVESLISLGKHDLIAVRFDSTLKHIVSTAFPEHLEVYVKAMEVLVRNEPDQTVIQANHLRLLSKSNPYMAADAFSLMKYIMSENEYVKYLAGLVDYPDARIAAAAMTVLRRQWQNLSPVEKVTSKPVYRTALIHALERSDRGLTYACAPLLEDSTLWKNTDTALMQTTVSHFHFPEDIEAYESLVPVLIKRYGWWGRTLIDSLASRRYPPFNTFLRRYGLTGIPKGNQALYPLYKPDWQRLRQLGPTPVWTLQTDKGTITIELDALRCPATVSAIDLLTTQGKYDGVPFHRVVPDFVIQGGDFERGDGFGGTSFVLPTEPSELSFTRGAVGMASAGYDTEGSQYFIMHEWAPHLNGHYTLFGQVTKGMDVVDRITPGDKVLHATIMPTKEEVRSEK